MNYEEAANTVQKHKALIGADFEIPIAYGKIAGLLIAPSHENVTKLITQWLINDKDNKSVLFDAGFLTASNLEVYVIGVDEKSMMYPILLDEYLKRSQ